MTSRTAIGMMVQATSSQVLCVVRDGAGLVFALKRTMTMTSSSRTKPAIPVMI